jgi:hypothetical protein
MGRGDGGVSGAVSRTRSIRRNERVTTGARAIGDLLEAIGNEIVGAQDWPSEVPVPERARWLRDEAIRTTLRWMVECLAIERGWPVPDGIFVDRSREPARHPSLPPDFMSRLRAWRHLHGGSDPLGTAYESALATDAVWDSRHRWTVHFRRTSERKSSGAFYTPDSLVKFILDRALEPVLDARLRDLAGPERIAALQAVRVLDPASGGGRLLIAAARRIASRIVAHSPSPLVERGQVLGSVLRACVFGIDIDPIAVEICRVNLWLTAGDPSLTPETFASNIRIGNVLLGATPAACAAGVPDEAFAFRDGDEPDLCRTLRRRNRLERANPAMESRIEFEPTVADAWSSAFLWPKTGMRGRSCPTTGTLGRPQPSVSDVVREHRILHAELEFRQIFERGGFDAIVGNPPFLNRLESATAPAAAAAALLKATSGQAVHGYADAAAAFLEAGSRWLAPGGRLALLQPQSILGSRDARGIRTALLNRCSLTDLWISQERMFKDASVYVCLPVLERARTEIRAVTCFAGPDFRPVGSQVWDPADRSACDQWSSLTALTHGAPRIDVSDAPVVADVAHATADFRDQYYGLAGFIVEDSRLDPGIRDSSAFPKIVTSGLIDLADSLWGREPARLHKRRWLAPRVDRRRVERDGILGPWMAARLVPKVLLATQTSVLEVVVDEHGEFLPSTPVLTIVPKQVHDVWLVAAALASPVACLVAYTRSAGTALTADAIKLGAAQVRQLPLPIDRDVWLQGAALFRKAQSGSDRDATLAEFGRVMCAAYGVSADTQSEVHAWWEDRRCT